MISQLNDIQEAVRHGKTREDILESLLSLKEI